MLGKHNAIMERCVLSAADDDEDDNEDEDNDEDGDNDEAAAG